MSQAPLHFAVDHVDRHSGARTGTLRLRRGDAEVVVQTPVFMPVGTLGSVKGLTHDDVAALPANLMLANAYHLMLRPGHALVAEMGGLHSFAQTKSAILTDSGGFQVFSLAKSRTISARGVVFRSHVDGALIDLTPERLVSVQEALAPNIAMVLDECPPAGAAREAVLHATERTTAWAERCLRARSRSDVAWFGIVQGGLFTDLRSQHAATMAQLPCDGFAIGGVSVGEATADIARIVAHTAPLLPPHKPRYLMGVGTPADLIRGVAAGIDMFDCVMPTRNARNGQLFTAAGRLSIKNAAWRRSSLPVDPSCGCVCCRTTSRSYLRHLFVTGELAYHRLASIHNLTHYLDLMQRMRRAIAADAFNSTFAQTLAA